MALLLVLPAITLAADRFWVGSGGNWNDTANWSTTSGGGGSASLPGTSDIAIFDQNSGDCIINQNIDVGGLHLTAAYTGTVTQQDPSRVQVRASHYVQDAGTFQGGTNTFTLLGGNFSLTGGGYAPGNDQLIRIPQLFDVNADAFEPGTATVFFRTVGATMTITNSAVGDLVLYRMQAGNYSGSTTRTLVIAGGTTLVVSNRLELVSNSGRNLTIHGPGTMRVVGDMTIDDRVYSSGNVVVTIEGVTDQTLSGNGGTLPTLSVDKPSGTLHLAGTLGVWNALSFLDGAVAAAHDSSVEFRRSLTVTGTVTLANVRAGNFSGSTAQTLTLAGDTVLVVTNQLTLENSTSTRNLTLGGTGRVEARGDVVTDNATYPGSLTINGDGDQTWTGGGARFPGVTIDKPSGTLFLVGTNVIDRPVTYRQGIIEPGSSLFHFRVPMFSYLSVSNATPLTLANVIIGKVPYGSANYWDTDMRLLNDSEIVIRDSLTLSNAPGTGTITLNGGKLRLEGDAFVTTNSAANGYNAANGAMLVFESDAVQNFRTTPDAEAQLRIPVEINKTGGELRLESDWVMAANGQTLDLIEGVLNLATNHLLMTGANTDFTMQGADTELKVTLTDLNTRLSTQRDALVDGTLSFYLAPDYMPAITDEIELITAGNPVGGTFSTSIGRGTSYDLSYKLLYNDDGNNVKLIEIRPLMGMMIRIR